MEEKNMDQTKQDILKLQIFSHSIMHNHKVVSTFLSARMQKWMQVRKSGTENKVALSAKSRGQWWS